MRDKYSEVNLPEKLKDGPTTLMIWLVGGLTVAFVIAILF